MAGTGNALLPFIDASAGDMFQSKIDENSIVNEILVMTDSRDSDETLRRVLKICRKYKIKHRQMPLQVYKHSFLWGDSVHVWYTTRSLQITCTERDAPNLNQKENCNLLRFNEQPMQILTGYTRHL